MKFISPTKGALSFKEMFDELIDFMQHEPQAEYRLVVGSDSQTRDESCIVTAVIIHRTGKGARYFYQRRRQRKIMSLRQKIFYETSLSLHLAAELEEKLRNNGYAALNVEIHVDVGTRGDTRDLIREIVGMVVGSGFNAKIKPDSFGASKVADRHTK